VRLVRLTMLSIHNILPKVECSIHVGPVCNDSDIRLVGTDVPTQGRLEVCLFGVWGTVCDDLWTDSNSKVVCRQLGYDSNSKWPVYIAIAIYICSYIFSLNT
jgi:hypothetical protein